MIALRISSALGLLSIGGKAPGRREAIIQNKSQSPYIIVNVIDNTKVIKGNAIDLMRFITVVLSDQKVECDSDKAKLQ